MKMLFKELAIGTKFQVVSDPETDRRTYTKIKPYPGSLTKSIAVSDEFRLVTLALGRLLKDPSDQLDALQLNIHLCAQRERGLGIWQDVSEKARQGAEKINEQTNEHSNTSSKEAGSNNPQLRKQRDVEE